MSVVGQDIPHDSAAGHVTGRSQFIDDILPARNEVFVDYVGSPVAHGRLKTVDASAALRAPGVVAIFTGDDVPGHNQIGSVTKDEHLLVRDVAEFIGDPIVIIVADSREALQAAKKAIRIEMEELPPIFSIEQAIARQSFLGSQRVIARGDTDGALASSPHVLEDELHIGGQDHFYLESHAAIAYPQDGGALLVQSSTQHPSEVQATIAEVLGIPYNHVIVQCRRMGGGFGGKETQAAQPAAMAALVAHKLGRPARIVLSKDDDMRFTGKRHPFLGRYRVGFTDDGLITALHLELFSNGGCSTDLSLAVLERAMLHSDNAYYIANFRVIGRVCKTNLPSNTAFRGFGGPQGVANIESIIESVARQLNKDALDLRQINCYGTPVSNSNGDGSRDRLTTPYGQIVKNNTLPAILAQLRTASDYDRRRGEIARFNASSRTRIKGLALTPVKFGISFTKRHMNQASALVNIYTDGTVYVTTGATEMGQGVHTRIRQLVADELGISYDAVIIGVTDTSKNNNTSPTAASASTDLNGAAAVNACRALKERIAEDAAAHLFRDGATGMPPSPANIVFENGAVYDDRRPSRKRAFCEVIVQAYLNRVNLGERGFYATPGVDFNRDTGQGAPFLYFTNGAACSEVLIDRFTGELRVTRVDLLMDGGVCINPGIDRGQVIGGFVQGMGWCTTEELRYNDNGELLSHSPTTYKIPNINDIPPVFNVEFFDNPDNTGSLKKSKALGEPPLLLGISVWAAVKDALGVGPLNLPATPEQILMRLTAARPGRVMAGS